MIDVGIVGGSGYTGGELLRLLAGHPLAKVVCVTSRKLAGKPVASAHPHIRGIYSLSFEAPSAKEVAERCDVVFTAVPHGTAMDWVPELLDAGTRVIDLSSDYRLPVEVFEKTYGTKHRAPRDAVFGLCELHPEVARASLVGNPGCYPTGATLAVAPLAKAGLVRQGSLRLQVRNLRCRSRAHGDKPLPQHGRERDPLQADNASSHARDQAGAD